MDISSADLLREARLRASLTQTELAQLAGVSQSVISAYESGAREPALTTLRKLVKATGNHLSVRVTSQTTTDPRDRLDDRRDLLRDALSRLGARNVRVFGSVARGDNRADSDVDLLIDAPEGFGLLELAQMKNEAERILELPVDVIPAGSLKPDVRLTALAEAQAL